MKRGFLGAKKAQHIHDDDAHTINNSLMSGSKPSEICTPTISAPQDYTCIYEESPLILQSDYRIDDSPYFGYFPPRASPGSHTMVYIDADPDRIDAAADWPVWGLPQPKLPYEAPYAIRSAYGGRGLGMFAIRAIPAGTLIAIERPFYVSPQVKAIAPDQVPTVNGGFHRSAMSRLSKQKQAALLSLSNCYPPEEMDEIPGKLGTNQLTLDVTPRPDDSRGLYSGCFETLSRANHSCSPNMNFFFHFTDFTGRFYAAQDIAKGEELSIYYCDPLASTIGRHTSLLRSYKFVCTCTTCTLDDAASKESDMARLRIRETLNRLASWPPVQVSPEELEMALDLAEKEKLWACHAQLFYSSIGSLIWEGKDASLQALQLLERARSEYQKLEGKQSYNVKDIEEVIAKVKRKLRRG